jgi:hypothetical protein
MSSYEVVPVFQAGEAGFQRKLKTSAVFIDLTAAYDSIWSDELMLKFMRVVLGAKLLKQLNNMISFLSSFTWCQ